MTRRRSVLTAVASSTTALTVSECLGDVVSDDSEDPENDGENKSNGEDETEDIVINASIDVTQDGEKVTVTFISSGNADHLSLRGDCPFPNETLAEIGDSATLACSMGDTISIVAVHESGAEMVLSTFTVS